MKSAKLFPNGNSQAVRLPKEFRFEGDEVFIKKTEFGILLIPKNQSPWDIWDEKLKSYDFPFMENGREDQGIQEREGLDEIFD